MVNKNVYQYKTSVSMSSSDIAATLSAIAASVQASVTAVTAACQLLAQFESCVDGRSFRSEASKRWTIRESQFSEAIQDPSCHGAWFKDTFRCSKGSFDRIVDLAERNWASVNARIGKTPILESLGGLLCPCTILPILVR